MAKANGVESDRNSMMDSSGETVSPRWGWDRKDVTRIDRDGYFHIHRREVDKSLPSEGLNCHPSCRSIQVRSIHALGKSGLR
jgi:hypothetical protein